MTAEIWVRLHPLRHSDLEAEESLKSLTVQEISSPPLGATVPARGVDMSERGNRHSSPTPTSFRTRSGGIPRKRVGMYLQLTCKLFACKLLKIYKKNIYRMRKFCVVNFFLFTKHFFTKFFDEPALPQLSGAYRMV